MSESNWVHLDVLQVLKETDKAFLFLLDDGEQIWIPKNHIANPDDYEENDVDCTISISKWIADQKGLSYD